MQIKKDIIHNYINDIKIEESDDMSNDPLVTFIRKKGSELGKSKLFEILLNNKYFHVNETNHNEEQKYNTLKNINIVTI